MLDKKIFHNILAAKWCEALVKNGKRNVVDCRASVLKENDNWEQTIYGIDEFDDLYNEVKECKDWYIDFYENIAGANMAVFLDVAFLPTEMPKEEKNCVWCVLINQVADCEELRNDVRIFAKEEDAKEYAKNFIADEMQYVEKNGWIIDDNLINGSWESYGDGDYIHNHTTLSLTKEEVL